MYATALLTAHQSTSIVPTRKIPLTYGVETITGFFKMCKKSEILCFIFTPPVRPITRFCYKVPLLSIAAQNYSIPKPMLPLEQLTTSSP